MRYNKAKVDAASTTFRTIARRGGNAAVKRYPEMALVIENASRKESLVIPEAIGGLELWKGSRTKETPILWTEDIDTKSWQKTVVIDVDDFKDASRLRIYEPQIEMLGLRAEQHIDELITTSFLEGFTKKGYDGVAFYASTHPRSGGLANQSNIQAGALDATTFRAALAKLDSVTDYHGKPIDVRSLGGRTVLEVGPSNRATAKTLVESAVTTSGAGNPDYKEAEIIVNPRLVGDYAAYWGLHRVGGVIRPWIVAIVDAPELVTQDDPKSDAVFDRKEVAYGIDGRWNVGYGFWQLSVGSTGT